MDEKETNVRVTASMPKGSVRVCFVWEGEKISGVSAMEFSGKQQSVFFDRTEGGRVVYAGLGFREGFGEDRMRKASACAVRAARKAGCEKIALDLRGREEQTFAALDGAWMGAYFFEDYLPESRRKAPLREIALVGNTAKLSEVREGGKRAEVVSRAVWQARRMGDQPANVMGPAEFAREAATLSKRLGLNCKVWTRAELRRNGFGGILAVGAGSHREPCLVTISPRQIQRGRPRLCLVGKAVTFDSGGLNIKSTSSMEDMKYDKLGGTAVLGALRALADGGKKLNLFAAIPVTDNMLGPDAMKPGDIIRMSSGETVEILNTDAEGRLILADALAWACRTWKPDIVVDFATLTGACMVAIGELRAGLFTDHAGLRETLMQCGEETGDRLWPLPMGEEFSVKMESSVAVIKNDGGRFGGACTAASFLKHFVDVPCWAHIDVAGPAELLEEKTWSASGATGFGVRLMARFAEKLEEGGLKL